MKSTKRKKISSVKKLAVRVRCTKRNPGDGQK
jgi:hypothetical protein